MGGFFDLSSLSEDKQVSSLTDHFVDLPCLQGRSWRRMPWLVIRVDECTLKIWQVVRKTNERIGCDRLGGHYQNDNDEKGSLSLFIIKKIGN